MRLSPILQRSGRRRVAFAAWPMVAVLFLGACGASVRDGARATQAPPAQAPPIQLPLPSETDNEVSADQITPRRPIPISTKVKVALLLPMSGPDAAIGRAMLDAAQMGVFDIADDEFQLTPIDTGGTPDGARKAAETALEQGVQLIIGPLFSASVAAVAPLARESGVNVVAFSNNRSVANESSFLIGLLPREQVRRIVSYAGQQGLRRFAALLPDSLFGTQLAEDLRDSAAAFGGALVRVRNYPPGIRDLTQAVKELADYRGRKRAMEVRKKYLTRRTDAASKRELRKLEKQDTIGEVDYDAVLLPQRGALLKSIAALMPFYDIDTTKVQLLGMASWHGPDLGSEPALVGAWYPAPQLEARSEFDERFAQLYGYRAPLLAALAYDATALASVLARSESGPNFSAEAITAPGGFAGTAGVFRFLPDGQSQRSLAVMEVGRNRLRVLSPAPRSFQELTN